MRFNRSWEKIIFSLYITIVSVVGATEDLDVPNTFIDGQKALAEEVNENFEAVEKAVNNHDERITANEAQLSIQSASDESLVLFLDASTFRGKDDRSTIYDVFYNYIWVNPENSQDYTYASSAVHLPKGAVVDSLSCYFFDNHETFFFEHTHFGLHTIEIIPGAPLLTDNLFSTEVNSESWAESEGIFESTIFPGRLITIDDNIAYRVLIYFKGVLHSTEIRFYGCKLAYQTE